MLNPDLDGALTVEDAAIRPDKQPHPPLSAEEQAKISARLRERHPSPPLSEEQIRKLDMHRGRRPTQEEIDGMNAARAAGIHTSIV